MGRASKARKSVARPASERMPATAVEDTPVVITSAMMRERSHAARLAHAERDPRLLSGIEMWELRSFVVGWLSSAGLVQSARD